MNLHVRGCKIGGNARATNKITGKDTLAQKIPIKKIGRSNFINKFVAMFEEIDKKFEKKFKRPLWANKKILKNGVAFNGSTSFIMNPEIHDDEVIPYKPTSGDIDIMVKESDKEDLWHLLDSFESKPKIMKDVEYKGSNKLTVSSIGDQINSVFEVTFGDIVTQSQVDFEFTKFQGEGDSEEPNEFSRFGHSSSLSDAQNGFKGVSHKYLLRALAGGASYRKDVLILQPSGSYDKPKFKKTKGEHITELRMHKFFVSKGIRKAYELQLTPDNKPWIEDGKKVYKEIPTEDSNYESSIKEMFKILFTDKEGEMKKMWSFVGILDLMKKHLDKKSIEDTFTRFLDLQWGYGGQKLERDDKNIDFEIKANAVNYFIKKFPALKKHDKKIKQMTDRFYDNYDKAKLTEEAILWTGNPFRDLLLNLQKPFVVPVTEEVIEYINEAEYKVPKLEKKVTRELNPKSNRMKNFKTIKHYETDIAPEKRSFKNLPRYADKKAICSFQQWLCIKKDSSAGHSVGKSPNGKWYGWSHRAVFGFEPGHVMKPGHIGNKFEYSDEAQKEYWKLYDKDSTKAEEYRKTLANFEPYKIKDDEDARQHAIRFAKDVS